MRRLIPLTVALAAVLAVSGCSSDPSAGPSVGPEGTVTPAGLAGIVAADITRANSSGLAEAVSTGGTLQYTYLFDPSRSDVVGQLAMTLPDTPGAFPIPASAFGAGPTDGKFSLYLIKRELDNGAAPAATDTGYAWEAVTADLDIDVTVTDGSITSVTTEDPDGITVVSTLSYTLTAEQVDAVAAAYPSTK